ncbi:putative protoporphyrinogen oxidase isoform 2 [Scophthalmus maximus]|uniref:Protoporphyrinogen oxidase n=1 Tax=Scophthalmus maximus TaxID=52904 RepID=A0A2U9AZQ6_SCOMX|nr:putative protoporphyrinogen oxidase isoform 2 [Scophthalmus maximus]
MTIGHWRPMRTVAVLGGGIGGLAASYYLCKSPHVTKVVVVEASSRCGGWLWSTRRADGAVFEHGPRGIRPAGAVGRNTLNMVDDLGLEGEILPVTSSHVASKNRFLYVGGRLHRMPSGISGLLRIVPPFSRPLLLSVAMEILVKKRREEDESIHSFVSRRLGMELADLAVDSLCRGVFAGDCRKLSVRSCFPLLYHAEQRRGSLALGFMLGSGPGPVVPPGPLAQRSIKESWAQWSLRRGVESLPESITDFLQQSGRVELHRDAAVRHVCPSASGWMIHLEDGVISADHIISALPAKALSSALPPSCQLLIQELQDIPTVTVAVVNLEYDGSILPVTVMMGGAWFQEEFGAPEMATQEQLLARATEAVRRHLGVMASPIWSRVTLQRDCIPQYYLGHHRRVESMRSFIRKNNLSLSLVGSCYDGVSVNDVIFSGRTAVEQLLGT